MAGGAAKSAVTPQLIADVTGLPLTCLAEGEGSLRGALVLARSLLPGQGSLGALAEEMAPGGRVVNPGTDHGSYQEQFKKYLQCVNQTFLGVSDATPLGLGSCLSIHPG
jgi:sugar (pentulose or hexulose) kinase